MTTDRNLSDKSTEQLRADLEGTRGDVAQDMEAISNKLRPRQLANQAKEGVYEAGRQAAGRVQEGAQTAWEQAKGAEERAEAFVRRNPVPLAMIGLGAAWLLAERFADTDKLRREAQDQRDQLREGFHDTRERISERVGGARGKISERVGATRARIVERSREVRGDTESLFHDNPLTFGAMAIAFGAGVGLLTPSTRRERELLGPVGERMRAEVQTSAEEAREAATEVAHETSEDARRAAREVAEDAKARSRQVAEDHGFG